MCAFSNYVKYSKNITLQIEKFSTIPVSRDITTIIIYEYSLFYSNYFQINEIVNINILFMNFQFKQTHHTGIRFISNWFVIMLITSMQLLYPRYIQHDYVLQPWVNFNAEQIGNPIKITHRI